MFFAREWPDMLKRKKYLQCSVVFVVLQARRGVWVSNKLDTVAGKKQENITNNITNNRHNSQKKAFRFYDLCAVIQQDLK